MLRRLFWCVPLAAVAALVPATPAAPQITPTETLIRLNITPAAEPKPALRYTLLPELKELSSGNPIPNYLKAIIEQEATGEAENFAPTVLRQADRAARLDKPDWQLLPRMRTDGIGLLLPDLQKMRGLASGLQTRYRDEIAGRRFDDALVTTRTLFALSRHTGDHPTLIGGLVGIAIAFVAIGPFEEMLEQNGCPNLYWALTSLPTPFISVNSGMEGERMLIRGELRDLDESAPMSSDRLGKLYTHIDAIRRFEPDSLKKTTREYVAEKAKDAKHVAAARERIVEYGLVADRVALFPPEQVVLLDERRDYEVRRDDDMKLMPLPTWEYFARVKKDRPKPTPLLFDLFLPGIQKVRQAQGRLEQRMALLRCVEAIRMHAAENGGKLPSKLDDIALALPVDPFTGKSFRYALEGEAAHLRGTPPPGEEKTPSLNIHYEITVRK